MFRTVRRGTPGTSSVHTFDGKLATNSDVILLFVCHAETMLSGRFSGGLQLARVYRTDCDHRVSTKGGEVVRARMARINSAAGPPRASTTSARIHPAG